MSISITGSSGLPAEPPSSAANRLQQSLKQPAKSLQPASSKPPVSSQNIEQDVGELRQALGSGDLSGASRAYAKLQTDLRIARPATEVGTTLYA